MKFKSSRLLSAALVAFACVIPTAFADDEPVGSAANPAVTLSWTPTSFNTDGSPITDLAGYYVYVGDSPDTLIPIYFNTAETPELVVWYPAGEVHFFSITAVNWEGVESAMTPVVSNATP